MLFLEIGRAYMLLPQTSSPQVFNSSPASEGRTWLFVEIIADTYDA